MIATGQLSVRALRMSRFRCLGVCGRPAWVFEGWECVWVWPG
jgi:hypothetical protein